MHSKPLPTDSKMISELTLFENSKISIFWAPSCGFLLITSPIKYGFHSLMSWNDPWKTCPNQKYKFEKKKILSTIHDKGQKVK